MSPQSAPSWKQEVRQEPPAAEPKPAAEPAKPEETKPEGSGENQ